MQQVLITAEQYTKLLAPSISNISPNNGPLTGRNTVTISGSNFMPGLTVFFGGQAAANIQVLSSTMLKVVVPARTGTLTETEDVVVQNPDGQQTSVPTGYTYASVTTSSGSVTQPNAYTYVSLSAPTNVVIDPDGTPVSLPK